MWTPRVLDALRTGGYPILADDRETQIDRAREALQDHDEASEESHPDEARPDSDTAASERAVRDEHRRRSA